MLDLGMLCPLGESGGLSTQVNNRNNWGYNMMYMGLYVCLISPPDPLSNLADDASAVHLAYHCKHFIQ